MYTDQDFSFFNPTYQHSGVSAVRFTSPDGSETVSFGGEKIFDRWGQGGSYFQVI
jgi:hypothetical protein